MRKKDGFYVFDTRDELMDELLHGKECGYLVGFECPTCRWLHVMAFTPRMIVFTHLDQMKLPASMKLTLEQGTWGVVPDKFCPADGTPMTVLRTDNNARIFA